MKESKWTIYIKALRLSSELSLRAASRKMNVSAPYLHDVENGERVPTRKFVKSVIELYKLDKDSQRILNDAAAEVLNIIPYDVEDFLKENPDVMNMVINKMNEKEERKTLTK